jgi:hypothetical protein
VLSKASAAEASAKRILRSPGESFDPAGHRP